MWSVSFQPCCKLRLLIYLRSTLWGSLQSDLQALECVTTDKQQHQMRWFTATTLSLRRVRAESTYPTSLWYWRPCCQKKRLTSQRQIQNNTHLPEPHCWGGSWKWWTFQTSCAPRWWSRFFWVSTNSCNWLPPRWSGSSGTYAHSLQARGKRYGHKYPHRTLLFWATEHLYWLSRNRLFGFPVLNWTSEWNLL